MEFANNILLTGKPGVGKTTIIMETISLLGMHAVGFFTQELRSKGKRVGFQVVSLQNNEKSILAHVDFPGNYKVSKYGVKPENLMGHIKEINEALISGGNISVVIDEIGKMELYTRGFKETVNRALDSKSPFLATIMKGSNMFCNSIKTRNDVKLIEVTLENRDELPAKIAKMLKGKS